MTVRIDHIIGRIEKYFFGGIIPLMLTFFGVFFAFYLFPAFLHAKSGKRGVAVARKNAVGREADGVSGFSALTVALAGTLGVGNITGVASALILGGAGSIFWMWISALLAMLLKYAEVVLASVCSFSRGSERHGGAMYYIKEGFSGRLGSAAAVMFTVFCLVCAFSMGSMLQAEAVSDAAFAAGGAPKILTGLLLSLLAAVVSACNIKSIPTLTSVIVPVMTLLYTGMALVTLFIYRQELPRVFAMIFGDALGLDSAASGLLGFLTSRAVRYGFMRGLLSNEAGCGTSTMAHSTSSRFRPAEQGLLGVVEVFVDTVLLCTLTALPLLAVCGDSLSAYRAGQEMSLVLSGFSGALGSYAAPLLICSVFFFAFATIVCWYYYGSECVVFLTDKPFLLVIYRVVFPLFVLLGACGDGSLAFLLSDLSLGGMTVINLVSVFGKRGIIKRETENLRLRKP